jgi:intracellular septation protein
MMSTQITLERALWSKLNLMWIGFFVLMGAVNLYVAYHYDESTWVNFKLFGILGMTLVFVVIQGFWLASKMPAEAPK